MEVGAAGAGEGNAVNGAATHKRTGRVVGAACVVWLVAAIGAGMSGVLETQPWAVAAGTLWVLALAALGVAWLVRPVRAWVRAVDVRALVVVHLTRFVGIWFLVLYSRGRLPYEFAVWGGWGDIGAAVGAVIILAAGRPPLGKRGRALVLLWNAAGLIDILFVVFAAAKSGIGTPGSMAELQRMPLSLLVTFIVPLIIATHVVMIVRLVKGGR